MRSIFLTVIGVSLFCYSLPALATSCTGDLKGRCVTKGWFSNNCASNEISVIAGITDCSSSESCCILPCAALYSGARCLFGSKTADCAQKAPTAQECNTPPYAATDICCLKEGGSGDTGTGTTSTKCNDHTSEGYYCIPSTSACETGDEPTSIYSCPSGQSCCAKPGAGTFTPGDDSNKQSFSYKKFIEPNSFTELILSVLSAIRGVVGWLAVIMIVAGGMMYMMSAGSHMTEMAKATITWAMIGFAIAVAAPTIINELYTLISTGGSSGSSTFPAAKTIPEILASVLSFLLLSVGILALIGFIISGVLFVTSAGNSSQADSARKAMVYTIIGVVVSGAGLIIVTQILSLLGGQS